MLKQRSLRDRKWLDYVRTCRCLVTGKEGHSERETVDPAHIGRGGKGIKAPDNQVIPLLHSVHLDCHQRGDYRVLSSAFGPAMRSELRLLMTPEDLGTIGRDAYAEPWTWGKHLFMSTLARYAEQEYEKWQSGSQPFASAGR